MLEAENRATLHANFMHIWMNGQALIGLGRMIESLTYRAYLTIVFLPSAVCGSIFSLLLMPNSTSVGASGVEALLMEVLRSHE